MGTGLAIAQSVIFALPKLLALFEQLLGPDHPDVVAAKEAVAKLEAAHAAAVSAEPQQ